MCSVALQQWLQRPSPSWGCLGDALAAVGCVRLSREILGAIPSYQSGTSCMYTHTQGNWTLSMECPVHKLEGNWGGGGGGGGGKVLDNCLEVVPALCCLNKRGFY